MLVLGQDPERVLGPWIEPGDRWTYRGTNVLGPGTDEYEVQVATVGAEQIQAVCTRKRDGKEFDAIATIEWNYSSSCNGRIFRPNSGYFQFPLRIGKTYPFKFELVIAREFGGGKSGDFQRVEGTVKVLGWEDVYVPAGRFRTLKVEAEHIFRSSGGAESRRTVTYWYSPEVRRWVKFLSESRGGMTVTDELLAFKLVQ